MVAMWFKKKKIHSLIGDVFKKKKNYKYGGGGDCGGCGGGGDGDGDGDGSGGDGDSGGFNASEWIWSNSVTKKIKNKIQIIK